MKKYIKIFSVSILILFLVLVLVNLFPVSLLPEAETILHNRKESEEKSLDKKLPLAMFFKQNDKPTAEKFPDYVVLMKNFEAFQMPVSIDYSNSLSSNLQWNQAYLDYLKDRPEKEKLEGLSASVNFLEKVLASKSSFLNFVVTLAALDADLEWMQQQKWSKTSLTGIYILHKKFQDFVDQREMFLKTALDSELATQLSFLDRFHPRDIEDRSWMNPFWKMFFNKNATMNEAYLFTNQLKEETSCLKSYSCENLCKDAKNCLVKEYMNMNPYLKIRNPFGMSLIKLVMFKYQSSFVKIQTAFKKMDDMLAALNQLRNQPRQWK